MHKRWLALLIVCAACPLRTTEPAPEPKPPAKSTALEALQQFLQKPSDQRGPLDEQSFASQKLSKEEAQGARRLLWEDLARQKKEERKKELEARAITLDGFTMRFDYTTFGEKPSSGHSLYLSLHGGGGAPTEVNDSQWENQKTLYQPKEGIYLSPRAPTDTWNLWHQSHIDPLFARLIADLIIVEGINPNRVYLMGYSAGGDGVYQVAPRMADYFAAASMMAGHPNEASPLGLRNIGFAIHVGELDSAYNRNQVAKEWGQKLDALQAQDPSGYSHVTEIHKGRGHWMNLEDASAVEWMAGFTRDPWPERVVWKQDDVTRTRFYWLSIEEGAQKAGAEVRAKYQGQTIEIESSEVSSLTLLLSDEMLDLDLPVVVTFQGREVFRGVVPRQAATIARSLAMREDPSASYSAKVTVEVF